MKKEVAFWRGKAMLSTILIMVLSFTMAKVRKKVMAQKGVPGSSETAWEKAANASPEPSMNYVCGRMTGCEAVGSRMGGGMVIDYSSASGRGKRYDMGTGGQSAKCLASLVLLPG
jgi:hypothetical protein